MKRILVLYYSMYGHIESMAQAVAEGARRVEDMEVVIKRVPETMPEDAFKAAGGKTDQQAPEASPAELADYDAVIVGTPTRFGNMSGQMRTFWDQTGGLWVNGALAGKVASVFTSTGTGGGRETTIVSTWLTLAHHGFILMPLGYADPDQAQMSVDEFHGSSPYGAGTVAGPDGGRQPSEKELSLARYQGEQVARLTARL